MQFNKRVLVVLTGNDADDMAFKRAVLIAERMQCAMDVLWLHTPISDQPIMQMVARLQVEGMQINVAQQESNSLIKDIQQRWEDAHFALLVKSCDSDHSGLMAPLDWQLLRQTPCPVLLVKRDSLWEKGKILAAIKPSGAGSDRDHLNQTVMMMAGSIARETHAELHVVAAFASPMLGAEVKDQSAELLAKDVNQSVSSLLKRINSQPTDVWVGEGPPEYWISHTAKTNKAALVVIGTQARSGLSGALLGNTAEKILDRLSCDVLVIRNGTSEGLKSLLMD